MAAFVSGQRGSDGDETSSLHCGRMLGDSFIESQPDYDSPLPATSTSTIRALAAACALLFVPLAVPLFTWQVFPFGDISAFHLPMRLLYQQALRAGDSFLWTSALANGLYLHAEGQTGMAHPVHLLLYRLPLTFAINVEMIGAYAFATIGAWLLWRRLGARTEAALGGAFVFAFGGFMLPHFSHLTALVVAAHVPWIVLAADTWLVDRRAGAFVAVALGIGSQVLLGFPQIVWMTALVTAWLAVYRIVTDRRLSRVALLAAALLLGLAIGGAQLLPTLDAARESFRSETTAAFRLSFSLHPFNLAQLVSPYALKDGIYAISSDEWFPHEFTLYSSALATLSVCWILARRRELMQWPLAAALLSLAALGLLLALGKYGGVYTVMSQLPVLSSLRASARHVLIVQFALSGLVALMLDDVMRTRPERLTMPRLAWVPVAAGVAVTAIAIVRPPALTAAGIRFGEVRWGLLGLAFAAVTLWLVRSAAGGARGAVAALVFIAALDLACWGLPFVYAASPRPIRTIAPLAGLPPEIRPGDLIQPPVIADDMNRYVLWRLRSAMAYTGIVRSSVLDARDPITHRVAGAKWAWTDGQWIAVDRPMPRVRLVTDWRTTTHAADDIRAIDVAHTALVDAEPGRSATGPGTAHIVDERRGRFRITTDAQSPELLVLAERFHDGWRGDVDGAPVAIRRVYGDYLGAVVPGGSHTVTLEFAPASARHGLWLTLAGLLATAAAASAIHFAKP